MSICLSNWVSYTINSIEPTMFFFVFSTLILIFNLLLILLGCCDACSSNYGPEIVIKFSFFSLYTSSSSLSFFFLTYIVFFLIIISFFLYQLLIYSPLLILQYPPGASVGNFPNLIAHRGKEIIRVLLQFPLPVSHLIAHRVKAMCRYLQGLFDVTN